MKSADKLPLETRCHISALAFTSKRRLSEPPVSSQFAAVCSMCVLTLGNLFRGHAGSFAVRVKLCRKQKSLHRSCFHGDTARFISVFGNHLTEVLVICKTVFTLVLSNRPLRLTSELSSFIVRLCNTRHCVIASRLTGSEEEARGSCLSAVLGQWRCVASFSVKRKLFHRKKITKNQRQRQKKENWET